jgi:hypothetical protein
MRVWTYGELKSKVESDLDLIGELFITPSEMLGYFNEAIDQAEAEIHKLGCEDQYFLTKAGVSILAGQSEYSLPENIYANKIKKVIYANGNRIYTVARFRGQEMFEEMAYSLLYPAETTQYKYVITNNSAQSGPQMVLFPPGQTTEANTLTIWFIRNANRLLVDADRLDIPEFASFVIQFVKVRCYEKEGHPNLAAAVQILQSERQLMIDTLSEMTPDDDNRIIADISHYTEMV